MREKNNAEPVAVTGRQAELYASLGKRLAAATRAGSAPNQRITNLPPPELLGRETGGRMTYDDGSEQLQALKRVGGANAVRLRLDMDEQRTDDPRYGTVIAVNQHNRACGNSGAQAVRETNAATARPTTAVEMASEYDVMDATRGPDGEPLEGVRALRDTFPVYHFSDLRIEHIGPHVQPHTTDRAIEAQNSEFASRRMAAGESPREPSVTERKELVVSHELAKILDQQERRHGMGLVEDLFDPDGAEASFEIAGENVPPRALVLPDIDPVVSWKGPAIVVPEVQKAESIDQHATTVLQAVSHAHLYAAAKHDADTAAEEGRVDQPAQARVDMYEAPTVRRTAANTQWAMAELAATYATVNKVTGIGAMYIPPAAAVDSAYAEKWAQKMEQPAGMLEVSRDIATIEQGYAADETEPSRSEEHELQRGRPERTDDEGDEGESRQKPRELRIGGDRDLPAPPPRPWIRDQNVETGAGRKRTEPKR